MKIILISLLLGLFSPCFAQSDTVNLNTPAVFSITFYESKKSFFGLNANTTYNEVYLDLLTKDFITIRKKFSDVNHPNAVSRYVRIPLKNIKSLGYATGTQETFGALLGAGIGIAGGTLIAVLTKIADNKQFDSKFEPGTISSITHPIMAFGGAGALLGYLFGGYLNKYESTDLTIYDNDNENEKKFMEIKKIVDKGINYSKKK